MPQVNVSAKLEEFQWIQGDLEPSRQSFPDGNHLQYQNLSPVELFEMFIDDEVLSMLIEETFRYALFKNCPDPRVTTEEMKCYIGILILTGYNDLPGKRFNWDSDSDMRNELVYNSMRRDRFLQISRFINFADDNHPDLSDKIWKMCPLIGKIKSKFLVPFKPEEHLCYDIM
ncbi:piggyBac transposable element-derived protein 2-like [Sitophilus oryzae]|uniref:PiggyBac transposable element-derived protein 2-like n=1 Tax=Sitophilus oryzae TaxID=7048 RepID=A0A6J2XLR7_SITOR|nr:piggyBac transposable element-derived protein 2-like [Sitophilus oryzae]